MKKLFTIVLFFLLMNATPLCAAPLAIADAPFAAEAATPINLMVLADDSGSMRWTHSPDDIGYIQRACWQMAGEKLEAVACGFPYPNPWPQARDAREAELKAVTLLPPPLNAHAFNNFAYNPAITYLPPVYYDQSGKRQTLPTMNKANTDNWQKVGWPQSVNGIRRPQGVPVTLNFAKFSDPRWYRSDPAFVAVRTWSAGQQAALRRIYLAGSREAELARLIPENGVPVPLHYFQTKVKWCRYYQTRDPADPQQHLTPVAFDEGEALQGSASAEDCQDRYSAVYQYPYYYSDDGRSRLQSTILDYALSEAEVARQPGIRYQLVENGRTTVKTRRYADELENYANWYTYYSNRTAALRSVASLAIDGINPQRPVRTGLTLINAGNAVNDVKAMASLSDPQHKYSFFKKLLEYGVNADNPSTPLKTAVKAIGDAFAQHKLQGCERNAIVALSDGGWNDHTATSNQDHHLTLPPPQPLVLLGVPLQVGKQWPAPLYEGSIATSDTLADVALKGWLTNLQPDGTFTPDITEQDPATWPHLNLIALAYGSAGVLPSRAGTEQETILKSLYRGEVSWPPPKPNERSAVDDLWHATLNGFGFFNASMNPADYRDAFESGSNRYQSGFATLENRGGSASAVGIAPDRDSSTMYFANYQPGWAGEVGKLAVNKGQQQTLWLASQTLNETVDRNHPEKLGFAKRKIYTARGESGVPFSFAGLSQAQRLTLADHEDEQRQIIDYLSGDASLEINNNWFAPAGQYRPRRGVLGDFVHGAPVVSDPPANVYTDKAYQSFAARHSGRPRMIYVAGNDGMLHAFRDDAGHPGNEVWAFIPPELLRHNKGIADLAAAERPAWHHQYYVDATPRVVDADLNSGTAGAKADWRTILIGGMGKGGTSYYALDVSEGETAGDKFLWTFSDPNMGYTFGRALIVRTRAWAVKKEGVTSTPWVAILPSGLNNGSGGEQPKSGNGKAYLYFVDLKSGKLLHKVEAATPTTSSANPLGLAHVRGYVVDQEEQIVSAVYGGDQQGNLWRFDLSSNNPADWQAVLLAKLEAADGKAQPVNSEPRFEISNQGGTTQRWIIVGSGRNYHGNDIFDEKTGRWRTTQQSLYAIKDGNLETHERDQSRLPIRRADLVLLRGAGDVDSEQHSGWVEDLEEGFQIYTQIDSLNGAIIYSANRLQPIDLSQPQCKAAAFVSRNYVRDVASGASLLGGKEYIELDTGTFGSWLLRDQDGSVVARFADNSTVPRFIDVAVEVLDEKETPRPPESARRSSVRRILLE